jgi:hypothetical protein
MADPRTGSLERASRRDFLTRALPGRVAALLGSSLAAATGDAVAAQTPAGEVSARDLRKMSRAEVRDALRRIRARRRAD